MSILFSNPTANNKSIFKECDGRVVRVPTRCNDDSVLFRISFGTGGLFGGSTQIWLPVTGFALEVGGNYQFLHTLSDFVYFYGFGDRVGELTVTGMAFIKRSCRADDYAAEVGVWNGGFWDDNRSNWSTNEIGFGQSIDDIQNLWDLYQEYKFSNQEGAIEVTWGNVEAFYGFLTGMRVEIARPDISVAQYSMRIHVLPRGS